MAEVEAAAGGGVGEGDGAKVALAARWQQVEGGGEEESGRLAADAVLLLHILPLLHLLLLLHHPR